MHVVNTVSADKETPYFSKFMDTIFIAHNTDTLEEATRIQCEWENVENCKVGLYLQRDTTNFEFNCGGDNDPKVLGYTYNDEERHTALLDLSILQTQSQQV